MEIRHIEQKKVLRTLYANTGGLTARLDSDASPRIGADHLLKGSQPSNTRYMHEDRTDWDRCRAAAEKSRE